MGISLIWKAHIPVRSVARLVPCEYTVRLSTVLLTRVANGTVSATPDVIHQAQFALDVKAKVLPLYEKVFDIEYMLPKLDTLVVSRICYRLEVKPEDKLPRHTTLMLVAICFNVRIKMLKAPFLGAMENWVNIVRSPSSSL